MKSEQEMRIAVAGAVGAIDGAINALHAAVHEMTPENVEEWKKKFADAIVKLNGAAERALKASGLEHILDRNPPDVLLKRGVKPELRADPVVVPFPNGTRH